MAAAGCSTMACTRSMEQGSSQWLDMCSKGLPLVNYFHLLDPAPKDSTASQNNATSWEPSVQNLSLMRDIADSNSDSYRIVKIITWISLSLPLSSSPLPSPFSSPPPPLSFLFFGFLSQLADLWDLSGFRPDLHQPRLTHRNREVPDHSDPRKCPRRCPGVQLVPGHGQQYRKHDF